MDASDWGEAQWIGKPGADYSAWTDYTASFDFRLNSVAFGTYLRASDINNAYMWQVNVGDRADSVPLLRPHLKVDGGYSLLGEVDLANQGFTRAGLLAGKHTLSFTITGTSIETMLDGRVIDTRTVSTLARGRIGVRTYGSESVTLSNVEVLKSNGTTLAKPDLTGANPFTGGSMADKSITFTGSTDALLNGPENNTPLMRTTFETLAGKTVRDARVYASARGVYEMSLNGEKVGDQFLAPGYTEYDKRIQSQTYDVTDQVRAGANALGATLGDGWWAGKIGLAGKYGYGSDLSLIARTRVTYTDGTVQWIDTNNASWTWAPGPFVATDNQIGETYDARMEQPGWNQPDFDDATWTSVVTRPSATAKLAPQPDEPVRATQILDTKSVTTPQADVTVYDLGQNMVGIPRARITGTTGETVKIRHAEVLNPDGTLYVDNLRAASATDYYTFGAEGTVTYQPTFSQHGFRYIEITGLADIPSAADVQGVVLGSDLPFTGTLETSDPMLNQLTSNVSWGARGNFLSIPTDTPARDERLGWTGDINVFGPTASYLFDTRSFLSKWMTDVRDEQEEDGQIPAVVPSSQGAFGDSGPGWQDAIVTVPYALYRAYDDTTVVRENWEAMGRFYDFAAGRIGEDNLGAYNETFFTTTDWLSLDNTSGASNEVKTTAIWADTVRMMAELADAVDDPRAEEFAARFEQIKKDFVAAYVHDDGAIAGGSQTGYAMALGMNLIDDAALKAKVGEKYIANLASYDFHLRTGFIGTPWLLPALSNIGRDDLAYTVLLQKDYPSWGYEIAKGATTVWERWNSIQPDGSFGPVDMNSFNHYAYGAVAEWMHQNIAGIRIEEPGYRRSIIAPSPGGGLTSGAGTLDTVYGELSSSWETTQTGLSLEAEVPVGTTSEIRIPSSAGSVVTESGKPLTDAAGVTDSRYDATNEVTVVTVGSGTYEFISTEPLTLTNAQVSYPRHGQAVVELTARNNSNTTVEDRVVAEGPSGWQPITASRQLTLAPGESTTAKLAVYIPADAAGGNYPIALSLGSAAVAVSVAVEPFAAPPTEDVLDHVDFGEAASEAAHQVTGSPSSGTSTEAGLTRRYANNSNPGAFYTAQINVTPGTPFVLRARETWNSAGTKDYDVYVDDVLVKHVRTDRSDGGQGVTTYQFLVDHEDAVDNDGTVTVKFEYPATNGMRQYYDPSIADLWVIDAPDTLSPTVVAAPLAGATRGLDGWYTSPVDIVIDASDDHGTVTVEYRRGTGAWTTYAAPVTIGDGTEPLAYRARDRAGNVSEVEELAFKVDTLRPTTNASISKNRELVVTARDANLKSMEYRIGNAPWAKYTKPVRLDDAAHVVHYRATDRAGLSSPTAQIKVPAKQAPARVTIKAEVWRKWQVMGAAKRATVRFSVSPRHVAAGNGLVIRDGARVVARVRVPSSGTLIYRLPRTAKAGKHKIMATMLPTQTSEGRSSRRVVLRVVRR